MDEKKRVVSLGKYDYFGSGRRINEVTLIVSLGDYFSVCGAIWNGRHTDWAEGGQCVDDIADKYGRFHSNVKNIRALWEVFHLCDRENIPARFLSIMESFISGESDDMAFEHREAAFCVLKGRELVTDYGEYTNGELHVYDFEGNEEVISFSQHSGSVDGFVERAVKTAQWLYKGTCLNSNHFKSGMVIESNREEHARKKEIEHLNGLAEIRHIAETIIRAVDTDTVGSYWSVVRHELQGAMRFIEKGEENK